MPSRARRLEEPSSRRATRYVAFAAACALQLIFIQIFVAGWRARSPPAQSPSIVMTQIMLRPAPSNSASRSAPALAPTAPLLPVPVLVTPLTPQIPSLSVQAVSPPLPPHTEAADWARAAQLAAGSVARGALLAQRRQQASGELEWNNPGNGRSADQQPAFPWSRQPLTNWLDFDPKTLTTSIKLGRHCELGFVLVLPVFDCVLGHVDPDPGRSDLFDPKFRPAPLELPAPALPQPSAPSATGP